MKRKLHTILLVVGVIVATHLLCGASAAVPGSRRLFAKWYYNNALWLFGGNGMDEASTESTLIKTRSENLQICHSFNN
jgi:hypothetical protein